MKTIQVSILIFLFAWGAWADDVLELQPRLAAAAAAQGSAYVELRDHLVAEVSTNVLLQAAGDKRLDWRERLVARIVLERSPRGADIQALRRYDWPKDPEFDPDWLNYLTGFAYHMGPMADKRIQAAGLWYYYLEINWKDTQETSHKRFGSRLTEVWPSYLLRAVSQEPEGGYRHRVMMDRLAADPPPGKHLFMRYFDGLINDHCSDAVPVLVSLFLRYLEMQSGQIKEPVEWPYSEGFPNQFRRIVAIADVRHAQTLLEMVNQHPWLETCREQVNNVRQRPASEAADSEPPFRLMPTPDFLKTGPFAEDVVDPYMRRDR